MSEIPHVGGHMGYLAHKKQGAGMQATVGVYRGISLIRKCTPP